MPAIFVDTVAWIALLDRTDALHPQAHQVMTLLQKQKRRLVTTEFVLLEVADALALPGIRPHTVTFINGLRQLPLLYIEPFSFDLLQQAWELYSQRLDKNWSLTDCTSFVVMEREKITEAFTADHHFEQAGFVNLLSA